MTIAILGATGQLGTLVIDALLAHGAAPASLRAVGRDPRRLVSHALRGIHTVVADFSAPVGLRAALEGVESLLLISADVPGTRVALHANVIHAAIASGATHLAYTSIIGVPGTNLVLAPDHRDTEALITVSGITATTLRNGWYHENFELELDLARRDGLIANSAGVGRIAGVARRDLADAAAIILLTPELHGRPHDLSGAFSWTFADLAKVATIILGRTVRYEAVSPQDEIARLTQAGVPVDQAQFAAMLSQNIHDGALATTGTALTELLGREPESLLDALRRQQDTEFPRSIGLFRDGAINGLSGHADQVTRPTQAGAAGMNLCNESARPASSGC